MNRPVALTASQHAAAHGDPQANHVVLAGPGSGKTRVLTERIAWLLHQGHCPPGALLATTFTTRAAEEIRARLAARNIPNAHHPWIGTFHAHGLRIMRAHPEHCPIPAPFTVMSPSDQFSLIRPFVKAHPALNDAAPVRDYINAMKQRGHRAEHCADHDHDLAQQDTLPALRLLYHAYERACRAQHLADYTELLLAPCEMLRPESPLHPHYRATFRHLLVDEAQDTNALQHRLIEHLHGPQTRLFAVGDDDQAIYTWRGANPAYLATLYRRLPDCRLHILDLNHRSTGHIVRASARLITHNSLRTNKNLRTSRDQGTRVRTHPADNPQAEAGLVAETLQLWLTLPEPPTIAVLYRTNAQSQPIEQALTRAAIAYRIRGARNFYARPEIRTALAWLRTVHQPDHDEAFAQTLLSPPQLGLPRRTVTALREHAHAANLSLHHAVRHHLSTEPARNDPAATPLRHHLERLDRLRRELHNAPLPECLAQLVLHSGLDAHTRTVDTERTRDQLDNLTALLAAATSFALQHPRTAPPALVQRFLEHAEASPDAEPDASSTPAVELMTAHSAKGLEFDRVWIAGLDEGIFPHRNAYQTDTGIEEERRVCYVALTRARDELVLSYPRERPTATTVLVRRPSRFIAETLPPPQKPSATPPPRAPSPTITSPPIAYRPDERVAHPRFGPGTVIATDASTTPHRIEIHFDRDPTPRVLVPELTTLLKL